MHISNDEFYLVTFKTACGCKQTQKQPEYVVRDMEFIHLPIRRHKQDGSNNWKFRAFKCVGVDTINRTALYEEYMP